MTLFAVSQTIDDNRIGVTDRSTNRAADYQARKESQRCTYPGCAEPPTDGSGKCRKHTLKHRTAVSRSSAKRRAELRGTDGKEKCFRCKKRSSTYLCQACKIVLGVQRFPTTRADNKADNQAHGIPAQWRPEPGTNWNRYRGKAKRGKPSTATLDDQDIDYAVEELHTAKLALAFARSPEVQAMPRIQREDIMNAALSKLDRAERWLDEVRDRHKSRGSR